MLFKENITRVKTKLGCNKIMTYLHTYLLTYSMVLPGSLSAATPKPRTSEQTLSTHLRLGLSIGYKILINRSQQWVGYQF